MTRILLLVALALFVLVALRRALLAGRASGEPRGPRGPRPPGGVRPPHAEGSPEHLVCGACGHGFDPEESGWICPRCGK